MQCTIRLCDDPPQERDAQILEARRLAAEERMVGNAFNVTLQLLVVVVKVSQRTCGFHDQKC